jgi:hypothetical protein
MNHCTYTNKDLYSEKSCIYLQILFQPLLSLVELYNTVVVQNSEVKQMLNQFVKNSVILCNIIPL